jgi:hypothetical protein
MRKAKDGELGLVESSNLPRYRDLPYGSIGDSFQPFMTVKGPFQEYPNTW